MPREGIPQNAAPRPTEGSRPERAGSGKRGRPKGSKNKPKGILPAELAHTMLLQLKGMLPPEHFEYMRGVIMDGKAISTQRELDTLIVLLGRNLYPALVMESMGMGQEESEDDFFNDPDAPESTAEQVVNNKMKMPVFRKDVTERLKVLQSLLAQKDKTERANSEPKDKQILTIIGRNGPDAERVRVLIGIESESVARVPDSSEQREDGSRTVSGEVLSGPKLLPVGEQDEADWVFDGDSSRGSA